ncbi:unnamed protein product [Heligmosomoides polygyrus]|uniref:G-patch domain-containing protein n=1 Tax=Heligmosomoides polygyrus TaxID=6339 RepID=A0A183FXF1_HELPZ|nr:unnamed protein product [Heligmosomoides polygyrus]
MQLLGISLGTLDPQNQNQSKSVDDFVSYCQQIQRRQEKEQRREKGEAVSSDDEMDLNGDTSTDSPSTFKHPFNVRTAAPVDGIKINIVSASSMPAKTAQEKVLDTSQLRLVYPVSSGVVHKESTDKWTPVVKNELKTCSDEQKKYVAVTSIEAERYRASISSDDHLLPPPPPPPVLTGLGGLLPPPPPPPKLTAFDMLLPPPPPLPQLLVLPPEEELIMKEPENVEVTRPEDMSKIMCQRASAQLRLSSDPNDFEAIRMLKEADEKMASWASSKNLPGKFTGSTGLSVLSSEELQPHDPRYNAWVKKVSYISFCLSAKPSKRYDDMFKNTRPTVGGVGMRLMQKMGWRPGEGLGPDGMGNLEPLLLDVKNDRKVLKHPVSMVMELCAKRKWPSPTFNHDESGPPNMREFRCTAVVNGKEYRSNVISRSKKDAKTMACKVRLIVSYYFSARSQVLGVHLFADSSSISRPYTS